MYPKNRNIVQDTELLSSIFFIKRDPRSSTINGIRVYTASYKGILNTVIYITSLRLYPASRPSSASRKLKYMVAGKGLTSSHGLSSWCIHNMLHITVIVICRSYAFLSFYLTFIISRIIEAGR